ncbi:unnamed protein product [Protopolystoma xenopodis]|uniref:Uncharacterized protein n=1 Tax=Protopolystoma xenopodis TaxID=117903 RepID=A0A448W9Y7_9PLAT|nr:unnamed protein product [Protopolystoma xenopodis]
MRIRPSSFDGIHLRISPPDTLTPNGGQLTNEAQASQRDLQLTEILTELESLGRHTLGAQQRCLERRHSWRPFQPNPGGVGTDLSWAGHQARRTVERVCDRLKCQLEEFESHDDDEDDDDNDDDEEASEAEGHSLAAVGEKGTGVDVDTDSRPTEASYDVEEEDEEDEDEEDEKNQLIVAMATGEDDMSKAVRIVHHNRLTASVGSPADWLEQRPTTNEGTGAQTTITAPVSSDRASSRGREATSTMSTGRFSVDPGPVEEDGTENDADDLWSDRLDLASARSKPFEWLCEQLTSSRASLEDRPSTEVTSLRSITRLMRTPLPKVCRLPTAKGPLKMYFSILSQTSEFLATWEIALKWTILISFGLCRSGVRRLDVVARAWFDRRCRFSVSQLHRSRGGRVADESCKMPRGGRLKTGRSHSTSPFQSRGFT